jgi:SAM-dependent methyltransferase
VRDHIDEKDYNRLAELESKHWENIQYDGKSILKDQKVLLQWENHPIVKIYSNISQTGNPKKDWLNFIVENFKKFHYGCSIGCGSGWVEKILVENEVVELMDCYDISEGAIEEAKKTNRYPQRLHFAVQDCNKIHLEAGKYDLILFHHSFHHLLELEHIITTIEKALSDDGIIFLVDYIGETRGQWEESKIKICKFILDLMPEGITKEISSFGHEFFEKNPFEMIRSSEILLLMNAKFHPIWQRNIGGLLYPLNNTIVSAIPERKYDRFIVLACIIDALCNEIIKPCFTFSIYTLKNNSVTIHSNDVSTGRILDFLTGLGLNTKKESEFSQEKSGHLAMKAENTIYKAIRYLHTHGLKKTLARSFFELSRRLRL